MVFNLIKNILKALYEEKLINLKYPEKLNKIKLHIQTSFEAALELTERLMGLNLTFL